MGMRLGMFQMCPTFESGVAERKVSLLNSSGCEWESSMSREHSGIPACSWDATKHRQIKESLLTVTRSTALVWSFSENTGTSFPRRKISTQKWQTTRVDPSSLMCYSFCSPHHRDASWEMQSCGKEAHREEVQGRLQLTRTTTANISKPKCLGLASFNEKLKSSMESRCFLMFSPTL